MKKTALLLAALLLMGALAACGASQAKTPSISPSKFSEETQQVLSILQDEYAFFEYTADSTLRSYSLDLWTCENGKWSNAGKVHGKTEPGKHRLAVRIGGESCDFFEMDEDGSNRYSYPLASTADAYSSQGSTRLNTEAPIAPEKEIALWVIQGTDQDSLALGNLDDFRSAECEAGTAVTITFSQQEANEKDQP